MNFSQRLRSIQRKNQSLLCIGLDTDINKLPESLFAYGDPIYEFNRRIIDATRDLVCAYKLNLAFYEATGDARLAHRTPDACADPGGDHHDRRRQAGDIGNSSRHVREAACGRL